MHDLPPLAALLAQDPLWSPSPADAARLERDAGASPPPALAAELRWWRALAAGRAQRWDEVSVLAETGLGEPASERETVRLAFLHCLSGDLAQAEHLVAQAVQTGSDEALPRRFAGWCEREGLSAAAARFR
ncbi:MULTISPECIES: hypothetical protein [Anaeromyxobacter]|uniref:hypothetical protein n=1 Tax=Anaeromyxobacter TaxID=161492 RepID=UPI001F5A44D5|nr:MULTISPECIES: hypothetical protein [unclassified Anaeromyxobacter]